MIKELLGKGNAAFPEQFFEHLVDDDCGQY